MEDPVYVFGRTDVTTQPWGPVHYTLVIIPETTYYICDYWNTYSDMRPQVRLYLDVMSAMTVERTHLVAMIDRCIKTESNDTIEPLWSWKAKLVLEKLQRSAAARMIQRQFRETMSNPAYGLCKRRLLREFAEGIQI